ncbi:hypothetical protein ABEB36_014801 [Hypothenemus hampei]|uniref:Uncharacterized protein n=1 Tax=Hypothenemus hampei TaxID=57062 RepID=A0ABD1E174_HYPHA
MNFKLIILALTLAYANAGNLIAQPAATLHYSSAPAVSSSYFQQASAPIAYAKTIAAPALAYQAAPVAVHAPSIGISQQSIARSLGGAQSVSAYSKAVDSAFSSVRKYDTRITNDALAYAPAQVAYAAPQVVTKTAAVPVAYSAPAQVSYSAPSPISYTAAPILSKTYSYAAPALSYAASAPTTYAAYSAPAAYATPVVARAVPAPAVYGTPSAPLYAKAVAAPVIAKTAAVAYSPASAVAHTVFQGYGIEYHY